MTDTTEKPDVEVAIYADSEKVTEVTVAIPLLFDVQPFPYEDKPNGPRTCVMRYKGAWSDEYDRAARRLLHAKVIKRFSRSPGARTHHHKKEKK